jgi:hypothetical protein
MPCGFDLSLRLINLCTAADLKITVNKTKWCVVKENSIELKSLHIIDSDFTHTPLQACSSLIRLILDLLRTTQQTSPPGGNKTSLLTLCGISRDCGCFTNMLMITTTVRMVDRVHGNTTSLWPGVALDGILVLGSRGLC